MSTQPRDLVSLSGGGLQAPFHYSLQLDHLVEGTLALGHLIYFVLALPFSLNSQPGCADVSHDSGHSVPAKPRSCRNTSITDSQTQQERTEDDRIEDKQGCDLC
jgi:hypothetical protein